MSFFPCPRCAAPMLTEQAACPHCHTATSNGDEIRGLPALIAGLLFIGCGDKEDTGDTGDTEVTNADYGIPDTYWEDDDGDGYAEEEGDCDDTDAAIHPGAEETDGDGVDSNCNGEDDT